MKRAFADAFFYLALLSERDAAHRKAVEIYRSWEITEMVTTVAVLMEVADGLGGTPRRERCGAFLASLWTRPGTLIVSSSDPLVQRGLKLYRDRPDKAWLLTDCISFVVMTDERLTEALTGDRHFEQAGFKALLVP